MPGSFDPFTLGHWDLLIRARRLFDQVVLAVGVNAGKQSLFTMDQRVLMARQAVADLDGVAVAPMTGLLVDFCREQEATVVVRGARSGGDFEAEWAMAMMNASLGPVETVLLPASATVGFVSSTLVRSVARAGGDVTAYVPAAVAATMRLEMQKEL